MKSYSYHINIVINDDKEIHDDTIIEKLEKDGEIIRAITKAIAKQVSSVEIITINPVEYRDTFIYKFENIEEK